MPAFARHGSKRPRLLGLCALILLLGSGFAWADETGPSTRFASLAQERDNAEVSAAEADMARGRTGGLAPHVPALETILAHAPKEYRKLEQTGGEIRYRAENMADFIAYTAWRTERAKTRGEAVPNIVWLPDTYPTASFLLGWYYNDTKDPAKAVAALDKGLAFAPMEARLIGEKGQAFIAMRRYDTALAIFDHALSADDFLADRSRALLLRAKGFCLTELKRLDAAEQAYRDSLVLEPDHLGAKNELAYIARIKAGGAPTAQQMTTYDKAKQGEYKEQSPR
jgi:tetratricopeptide (TPR) repeat protein